MRHLLTIIRYELLMQLKSIRFKGLCVVILLVDLALYMAGMKMQELNAGEIFFDKALVFYLPAIVFAGLFSVGRIRLAGMHSILMVRPFNTFVLMMGQLIAALISCIIPLFLFLFPTGLVLRWQYDIDFPLPPLLYSVVFFFIPSIFCVLAITIWVRTCFKNNLVSIIILALIFAGAGLLGKTPLLNAMSPEGQPSHNFVPLISVFSQTYWRDLRGILTAPSIKFLQTDQWARFFLSIICSGIFLILACYHLRRTEPHRKVIGNYGRRWYHTPTFLKIACDLKVDPHMTWKTHLVLIGFTAIIIIKVIMPLDLPFIKDLQSTLDYMVRSDKNEADSQNPISSGGFVAPAVERMTEQNLFVPTVLHDEQEMSLSNYVSKMTISIKDDPTSRVAAVVTHNRFSFRPNSVTLDGKSVPFVQANYLFLDGNAFAAYRDGNNHQLVIKSKSFGADLGNIPSLRFSLSGYYFCDQIKRYLDEPSGELRSRLTSKAKRSSSLDLTLVVPSEIKILHAPVKPAIDHQKKTTVYRFRSKFGHPASSRGGIYIAMSPDYRILSLPDSRIKMQVAVHKSNEKLMRDLLLLEKPVIEEFYDLHDIAENEDIFQMIGLQDSDTALRLKSLRRTLNRYRNRGIRGSWEKDNIMNELAQWEELMLNQLFNNYISSSNIPGYDSRWDLYSFAQRNYKNGLNHSISANRSFESRIYWPAVQLDLKAFQKIYPLSRKDIFDETMDLPRIPVFQMLYSLMGHDDWMRMLKLLKVRLRNEELTVDFLEQVTNKVAPEPLNWFFDYWCRTGTGFPSYKALKATARILNNEADSAAQYEVEAEIQNIGTGRMQVPVLLWMAKDNITEKIWIGSGETVVWKTTCRYMPKSVEVNPFQWICAAPYLEEKTQKPISIAKCNVIIEEQKQ